MKYVAVLMFRDEEGPTATYVGPTIEAVKRNAAASIDERMDETLEEDLEVQAQIHERLRALDTDRAFEVFTDWFGDPYAIRELPFFSE